MMRLPHADATESQRREKAAGIIDLVRPVQDAAILDVGTGSGHIASAIAQAVPDGSVHSVDVVDVRTVPDGYEFSVYDGWRLPFADGEFDVVVSNHVIEHVGARAAQQRHLDEIARVLAPAGVAYLAAPLKYRLIEPHYKLPLLSWLSPRWADVMVRVSGRGTHYDVVAPTRPCLRAMIEAAGLREEDKSGVVATRMLARLALPRMLQGPVAWTVDRLRVFYPSYVALLRRAGGEQGGLLR